MKIKIVIDNKEQLIDAEKITINGVTLENIVNKLTKLENAFNTYKKQEEAKTAKIKKTWDKLRT
jgi:hypothetical protein